MSATAFVSFAVKARNFNSINETTHCSCRRKRLIVSMRDRSFWVLPHDKTAVTTALEANITHFLFTDNELKQQCSNIAHFSSIYVNGQNEFPGGVLAPLSSPEDVHHLMKQAGRYETVIIDPKDWKQIPAENLVASFQPSSTKLFAIIDSVEDASTMFTSLQSGVDGCILRTADISQIAPFAALMRNMSEDSNQSLQQQIIAAEITSLRPVGVGHRVCIDMCTILTENEGLMVGSSSQGLYLILSEAAETQYCPSRPFRVNAGPVHAYCLIPGGKTRYLAELKAGDEVTVVSNGGKSSRTATVGRAKIETRPLIMLETTFISEDGQSHHHNVFLQNAETVRVATVKGDNQFGMTSVAALTVGERMLLKTDTKARHIGMPIDEYLIEK